MARRRCSRQPACLAGSLRTAASSSVPVPSSTSRAKTCRSGRRFRTSMPASTPATRSELTARLSITASARFNSAQVDLSDKGGGDLSGRHAFNHVNPSIGATYRVASWLTPYASVSEANRAPTPAELSCAGPSDSCSLANFFVGDPDLKQVIAHTVEAGVRGTFVRASGKSSPIAWACSIRTPTTTSSSSIVPNSTAPSSPTLAPRDAEAWDASLVLRTRRWTASIDYAYVEATYGSSFVEAGGSNPAADASGNISIRAGDRLPGCPAATSELPGRRASDAALERGSARRASGRSISVRRRGET